MEPETNGLCPSCNLDTHWGCDGPDFCECFLCRVEEMILERAAQP